jgi:hypothetical protein
MFEHLSTFDKVLVVAWVLVILSFGPTLLRSWKGRREDWMELGNHRGSG